MVELILTNGPWWVPEGAMTHDELVAFLFATSQNRGV